MNQYNILTDKINYALNAIFQLKNDKQAAFDKNYFRSSMDFLGVSKKDINIIGKKLYKEIQANEKAEIIDSFNSFWTKPNPHEYRTLSIVTISYLTYKLAPEEIAPIFKWLNMCYSWDHLDEICIKIIGAVLIKNPQMLNDIFELRNSDLMWVRRASLLCHLPNIRRNSIDSKIINETCISLVNDNDFFIRKAIGWVLREISQKSLDISTEIVNNIGSIASNLTVREATRKMPENIKNELLTKYIK